MLDELESDMFDEVLDLLSDELDDELEREEHLVVQGFDQTELVEENDTKLLPEINTRNVPTSSLVAEKVDDNGFEWIEFEGENWYRVIDSNDEWIIFE